MSISDTITEYVEANFVLDGGALAPDDSLKDSGLIDSAGMLDLLLYLEETFDITIEDDDVLSEDFETIGRLSQYVELKRRRGVSAAS